MRTERPEDSSMGRMRCRTGSSIAFLDGNYSFERRHGEKIADWLRRDSRHTLVVLAYDDREIMLDGKKIDSDSGKTWRATRRMIEQLSGAFPLAVDSLGEFLRYRHSQIEILLHPNPDNRILHTVMIGGMNGYLHALLVRRPEYERDDAVLRSSRAYEQWIDAGVVLPAATPAVTPVL